MPNNLPYNSILDLYVKCGCHNFFYLVCKTPASPLHGSFLLGDDKMSATFTCEPGYTLSGHSMVSCLPEGKGWNYEFPHCSEYIFSCEVYHQKNVDALTMSSIQNAQIRVTCIDEHMAVWYLLQSY